MLKHDWGEIEKHLLAVLTLDPVQRRAYLDQACDGQASLRREVESLLASEEQMGDFLEPNINPSETHDPPQLRAGQEIGPYSIEREIGRGGMSVVYSARREDLQRQVAIKVIKRGMDSAEIVKRFVSERQILAQLNHPSIAQLYDGGTTPDGLPFFVLELVDGIPIDDYCDRHRLTLDARIDLFRKVCSAVHYAHQNLVVHRDLKPGNILVTAEGVPKLLDFGIAKLLDSRPGQAAPDSTVAWMRLMTPSYASPEQVRGEPITTACDVYSLGVLFHQLMTGQLPFEFKTGLPQEMDDIFRNHRPIKPSLTVERSEKGQEIGRLRQTRPSKLSRQLDGDLDTIVLTALQIDPQRRYRSVLVFAEDLRRSGLGLTIAAREDSVVYSAISFLRRNVLPVAVTFLIVVLVFGFAVLAWVNAARVEREKLQTEQVAEFLVALFDTSAAGSGRSDEITARELLERGAVRVENELEDQPAVHATLIDTIGRAYSNLQLTDRAIPLFEHALEIRTRDLGESHPLVAATIRHLAIAYRDAGNFEASVQKMEEALEIYRASGEQPGEVATTLNEFAHLRIVQGQVSEGAQLAREALRLHLQMFSDEDPEVARSRTILASCLLDLGQMPEAEWQYEKALASADFLKMYPADQARALNGLGFLLASRGEMGRAEERVREGLAIRRRLFGEEHPLYADGLSVLSFALMQQGRYPEALPHLRQAIAIHRERYGPDHPAVAREQFNLAWSLGEMGRLEEAEEMYRQTLDLALRVVDEKHPRVANLRLGLASVLQTQGNDVEAEALFSRAARDLTLAVGEDHIFLAYARVGLGGLDCDRGAFSSGAAVLRRALPVIEKAHGEQHWRTVQVRSELGGCLVGLNELAEAEALFAGITPFLASLEPHALASDRVRRQVDRFAEVTRPRPERL